MKWLMEVCIFFKKHRFNHIGKIQMLNVKHLPFGGGKKLGVKPARNVVVILLI